MTASEDEGRRAADEGSAPLEQITARLEQLARELEGDLDPDRAAELVREASELATRAGQEVERALSASAEARGR